MSWKKRHDIMHQPNIYRFTGKGPSKAKEPQNDPRGFFGAGNRLKALFWTLGWIPGPKLGFFRSFSLQKCCIYRKSQFLATNCQNSSTLGVFWGGKSIGSIILDAWMGPRLQNLEFYDFFVTKTLHSLEKSIIRRKQLKFEFLWAANRLEALFWTPGWVLDPKTTNFSFQKRCIYR